MKDTPPSSSPKPKDPLEDPRSAEELKKSQRTSSAPFNLSEFWQELKHRKVVQVGITYMVVSWVILEVASTTFDGFNIADWAFQLVFIILAVGFPVMLILTWIYDLTPQGVRNTNSVREEKGEMVMGPAHQRKRTAYLMLFAVAVPTLLFGVLVMVFYFQAKTASDELTLVTRTMAKEEKSIAVLPLENLSVDASDGFLAAGLHNELTTVVSKIRSLKTISRNSTIRYRDTNKPFKTIAAELGVVSLLTGAVQRIGKNIRINVQLIDPQADQSIWGESFIREFTPDNLFAIQSDISKAIAMQLSIELSPRESENIAQVPTQNLEAFATYLKGMEILMLDNKSRMPEAIELFSLAVELDPKFTLAWAGLARSFIFIEPFWGVGGENEPERLEKLHAAAEMAFSLDSGLAEVQALQGYIHNLKGDRVNARAAYERAIEINPNYAEGLYELGNFLFRIVTYPDAADCEFLYGLDIRTLSPEILEGMMKNTYMEIRELLEKAVELEPTNPAYRQVIAYVYGQLDQPDEEIAQYKLALQFNPDKPFLNRMLGMILWYAGHLDEGIIYYRRAIALDPNRSQFSQNMSDVFFHMGDNEEAARWWLRVESLIHPDLRFMYRARAMEHLGNRDEAYRGYRERLSKVIVPYWAMYDHMQVYCDDFRTGRFEDLKAMFYEHFPQLFEPDVSIYKVQGLISDTMLFGLVAQDLAPVLAALGEHDQAEHLMNEAWHHWRQHYQAWRKEFFQVIWHIMRGENQQAIQLLSDIFDAGMRDRYHFYDARLDPIREDPGFVDLLERFEADMAQQRANVKRMESNGELAAIPKLEIPENEDQLVKFFPGMKEP